MANSSFQMAPIGPARPIRCIAVIAGEAMPPFPHIRIERGGAQDVPLPMTVWRAKVTAPVSRRVDRRKRGNLSGRHAKAEARRVPIDGSGRRRGGGIKGSRCVVGAVHTVSIGAEGRLPSIPPSGLAPRAGCRLD